MHQRRCRSWNLPCPFFYLNLHELLKCCFPIPDHLPCLCRRCVPVGSQAALTRVAPVQPFHDREPVAKDSSQLFHYGCNVPDGLVSREVTAVEHTAAAENNGDLVRAGEGDEILELLLGPSGGLPSPFL